MRKIYAYKGTDHFCIIQINMRKNYAYKNI